jgi:hypothetical protein
MKTKTKAFLNELLSNPKISNTEAYIRTHQTTNRRSASVSAAKLLAKPSILIYLEEHAGYAERRITELMYTAGKEEVQLRAAQDILDRSYGKPVMRKSEFATGVTLNIDLSTSL